MTNPLEHPEEAIPRVYAYVAYRIGDGPDAEDVTSEVIERALRYRKGFDPRRGEPVAWLLGIARRRISDKRKSLAQGTRADVEPVEPGPEEATPARLDLQRALGGLSDRDRELIALRYGADLSAKQIADVVGMRTNAVEVAIHRALRVLRAELDDRRIARIAGRARPPAGD
jgi:RNA polymerase sigma-70 factor (ECF subfamily)